MLYLSSDELKIFENIAQKRKPPRDAKASIVDSMRMAGYIRRDWGIAGFPWQITPYGMRVFRRELGKYWDMNETDQVQ